MAWCRRAPPQPALARLRMPCCRRERRAVRRVSSDPLREENDVAVRILDAEFPHPVELVLQSHHDPGAAGYVFEELVDSAGVIALERKEHGRGSTDFPGGEARDVVFHSLEGIQEHVDAVALHPGEHERWRFGN